MKKIVLAAAAAASAMPLLALAQSSVTLYGRMNVGIENYRFGSTPTRQGSSLTVLTSDASHWGIRGSEDLGSGNRAYFKAESGFQADSGVLSTANQPFSREVYVGLSNPELGSLQVGSQYGPGLWQSLRADPFLRFGPGGQPYLLQVQRGYTLKYENALQYATPTWGGLSARFYMALGEGQATGRANAVSVDYASGPFYAGAFVEQVRSTAAASHRTVSVAGSYDFTSFKLQGQVQQNRMPGQANVSGYLLGVNVPVGLGQIKVSYVHKDAPGADASSLGVGYWHALSKRTTVYGNLARLTNKGGAAYRMGPGLPELGALGGAGPVAGQNATAIHLGVMHTF